MLEVTTTHYLVLSFVLFAIGIFGVAARRSMITRLQREATAKRTS